MKLREMFKKLSTKTKAVAIAAGLTAIVAIPLAVMAEYYPARPAFDYTKAPINGTTCVEADGQAYNRCGSMTGPVFNSFTNTPFYGDERAFLDGRRTDQAISAHKDKIEDVTQGSREVVLRTYIHNNANQDTNNTVGVAKDTKVRVTLPTATASVLRARSYISASNATMVEDTADMLGSQQFNVEYIPGSAILRRGNTTQYPLSDSIVTTGALVGDKQMNGSFPGCFDYAAFVEVRVRIKVATSDLNISKQVRKHVEGQTGNWKESVSVTPGTKVDYLINTKNNGTATLSDVTISDALPPHLQLVAGSVKYLSGTNTYPQNDTTIFGGGIITGKYAPAFNSLVTFSAVTKGDFDACSTMIRNVAYAKSSTTPEINDTADVTITKEDCNPPVTPVYSCDALTASKIGDKKYSFTTRTTALNGAVLKNLNYNYGDNTSVNTLNGTTQHEYAQSGTYNIQVVATFTVNGQDKVVTSPTCATKVTITDKPVTPVYSCDALTSEKLADRNYRYTLKYTARDGATLRFVSYDYGDGSKLMSDKLVTEHTYAKEGTYVTRAVLTFDVNGQTKTVDSDKCATAVTIVTPPVTPPTTTPPTTTTLIKTGPADMLGLFSATTILGAVMHRSYASRKQSRR